MDKLDEQIDDAKANVKNESRKDRQNREDRVKDLEDKRRQLTDSYYKVQRASDDDLRKVRRETNRIVDDIEEAMEKLLDKADKK